MDCLSEEFYYDESSKSCLRWKSNKWTRMRRADIGVYEGEIAGYFNFTKGYYVIRGDHVHRVIYRMFYGEIPEGMEIDHEDRNKCNNQIWNLRLVTPKVNRRNLSRSKLNKTGVTGVHREGNRWMAMCRDHITGQRTVKWFSTRKHGNKAFSLACQCRAEMIAEQNRLGAGYSDTHGKNISNN